MLSADGRCLAFASAASNLIPGDTNGFADTFWRDRQTGRVLRVSLGASGAQPGGACSNPAISGDGRLVAFDSTAPNLVAPDANLARDVFLWDAANGPAPTGTRPAARALRFPQRPHSAVAGRRYPGPGGAGRLRRKS